MEDAYYMEQALDQARDAFDRGEFPVGCVIACDNEVVARGARSGTVSETPVFSEVDHAEIRALRDLEACGGVVHRQDCTLYCTMEPCLMCFGAIILSGIKRIVYAFEDPMGGGTSCRLAALPPLYRDSAMQVKGGVLRQKSLDLFYKFFNKETNLYWKDSFLEAYTREQQELQVRK